MFFDAGELPCKSEVEVPLGRADDKGVRQDDTKLTPSPSNELEGMELTVEIADSLVPETSLGGLIGGGL